MSHVPGTILKNCKGEYGVVLENNLILRVSKEQAEFIAGARLDGDVKLDDAPAQIGALKMPTLVNILQAANLIAAFIVPTAELALKIKSHFELDPSLTVNVTTLEGEALDSDDKTMAAINAWRQSVGLPPMGTPPSAISA
jgi:hypothetical protein